MPIIEVALDVPLNRLFDYEAPDAIPEDIGRRVKVPFGNRETVGLILGLKSSTSHPAEKVRSVGAIWRDIPPLGAEDLELFRFCSQYYRYPLGSVVLGSLPPALRKITGWTPPKRRTGMPVPQSETPLPPLTEEQRQITDCLKSAQGFAPFLLHGVTGSGKTEVYLQIIGEALSRGQQVLVLVPEINLTPQLEHRFGDRFPHARLISLHSKLGEKERAARWLEAQQGLAQLVLGTRLAVFTPMPRLGLIIVDEEHDPSYKQQEGLRYSARDLALVRGRFLHAPVILGSATPSIESWHNASQGRYHLLKLTHRAVPGARLPQVRLLSPPPMNEAFSAPLLDALEKRLRCQEQSLIFINRRGHAPVLLCDQCGWAAGCNRCSARMVVHLRVKHLRCHHCGENQPIPQRCPTCGNTHLLPIGEGTQNVEEQLRLRFPEARLLRVDRDSLTRREDWEDVRKAVEARQVDILVGTQMLAKGHDFPHLTLVAALQVDSALYSSDFRAGERLFAQLMQVAGRAGRHNQPGEVLVQTAHPEHPLFEALIRHDFPRFAGNELSQRKLTGFPPYVHQAILRASAPQEEQVQVFMEQAANLARTACAALPVDVFDPVAALMPRRAGKHRMQLLVQGVQRPALQAFLGQWSEHLESLPQRMVSWVLDVDPLEV